MSSHEETEETDSKFENKDESWNKSESREVGEEGEKMRRPWSPQHADPSYTDSIIQGLSSDEPMLQEEACLKLLSPQLSFPSLLYNIHDAVIDAGLIPKIIDLMNQESPQLQQAVLWVVATFAKTDPKLMLDKGAVENLIPILQNRSASLSEPAAHALCSLGATSGGSDKRLYVNELRDAGIVPALIQKIGNAVEELKLNKSHLLALMKLAKAVCYVPKNVKITNDRINLLEPLCDVLLAVEDCDVEILYQSCWALYYLTKSGNESVIERVVGKGVVPKLTRATSNTFPKLMKPTLNVLGNIISSSVDSHTDAVIFSGGLSHLKSLILEPRWTGEVNWIVSNVAAGSVAQKEALFQAGFFPLVLEALKLESIAGPKEAVHTILNVLDKGSMEHKRFFVDNGFLPSLAKLLKRYSEEVLTPVVDAVYLFVKTFIDIIDELGENDWMQRLLNESGILLVLVKYQDSEIEDVCDRVSYILDVGNNNFW